MPWKFFDSTGSEKVITIPRASLVTALPSSPNDGDEIILTDSLTAPTYTWRLRYVAAKSSNKWVCIGGVPGFSEITTQESTTSTTYVALTTAGPSFALPVDGDYMVEVGAAVHNSTVGSGARMSYDIGGTGAVDADHVGVDAVATSNSGIDVARARRKTGLTAVTLTAKYRATTGDTATFADRWMRVMPVAIGG